MQLDFLDFASKADELKISEAALRARILSRDIPCYIYLAGVIGYCEIGDSLPEWNRELHKAVEWIDKGIESGASDFGRPYSGRRRYEIRGFVGLDSLAVQSILANGEHPLNGVWVWVGPEDALIPLFVRVPDKQQWVVANPDEYSSGGYLRPEPVMARSNDLFLLAEMKKETPSTHDVESNYPEELKAAIESFLAVHPTFIGGKSPKAALTKWLREHKPELSVGAVNRISTVANWQQKGGAPKTPN